MRNLQDETIAIGRRRACSSVEDLTKFFVGDTLIYQLIWNLLPPDVMTFTRPRRNAALHECGIDSTALKSLDGAS